MHATGSACTYIPHERQNEVHLATAGMVQKFLHLKSLAMRSSALLVLVAIHISCLVSSFHACVLSLRRGLRLRSSLNVQTKASHHFDYLVIGAGSGGIASARRAAGYGANVAVIEGKSLGGTCVNVGCVPKKVMYNAGSVSETLHDAHHFGFKVVKPEFDWLTLKEGRDLYISKLNAIYKRMLEKSNISLISGQATFSGPNTVNVNGNSYSADNILVAVGGRPSLPSAAELLGVEHCLTSDTFFALESQPRTVAVVGAGYIGVELAGVFNALGSTTDLFTRRDKLLSAQFDDMVVDALAMEMGKRGVRHMPNQVLTQVLKNPEDGTLTLLTLSGQKFGPYDQVQLCIC